MGNFFEDLFDPLGIFDSDSGFEPVAKAKLSPGAEKLETGLYESIKTELFPENLASKFLGDAKKMFQARKKISTRAITSAGATGPEGIVTGNVGKGLLASTSLRLGEASIGPRKVGQAKRAFSLEHLKKLQQFINLQAQAPILQAEADLISGQIGQAEGAVKGAKIGAIAQIAALAASDVRVKENITPFKGALEKVRQLKPYLYNYIWQKDRTIGVMAQDVEKVLPEAVVEINGIKHVNTYAIQALIIGAINELLDRR
jgi:hypothetical protein